MKLFGKILAVFMIGAILISSSSAVDLVLGDVDQDGTVTRKDAMMLRRYWADWSGYQYTVFPGAGDINQDGILNAEDADVFSRYYAGDIHAGNLVGQPVSMPKYHMMLVVATDMDDVAEDGLRAPTGYVALRIVNEDGSLQDELYYASCADMNLYGHMDEMALGQLYYVLCNPDTAEDGMLYVQTAVNTSVSSARTMTVKNNGITDDNGTAYAMLPIKSIENSYLSEGFYLHTLSTSDLYEWTEALSYSNNPYAAIQLYDIDYDQKAEIISYKDYKIGYFTNSTIKCYVNKNGVDHSAGVHMPTYRLSTLDGSATLINVFAEAEHEAHSDRFAWINVDPTVTGFVNEDGTYNNGVVIFNYNQDTGEIEVVKYISAAGSNTDADSYIGTGVLQAFSTANATVTIDGLMYAYGYDSLPGNTLNRGDGSEAARSIVAEELNNYLLSTVTYLVVDGMVVDIDLT